MTAPTQRRRERTRNEILAAALALTESTGIDGWTMRQLADQVDYTPGAIYRYFENKAALVAVLRAGAAAELGRRLLTVPSDIAPLERLSALAMTYVEFACDEPAQFRLLFMATASGRMSLEQPPASDSPYSILVAAVEAAVAAGDLSVDGGLGIEDMAYSVWAMAHGMAVLEQTHLQGFDADFETIRGRAVTALLAGLASR